MKRNISFKKIQPEAKSRKVNVKHIDYLHKSLQSQKKD